MQFRLLILLGMFFGICQGVWSQSPVIRSLETPISGQGRVSVKQDARLDEWLKAGTVQPVKASSPAPASKKPAEDASSSASTAAGDSKSSGIASGNVPVDSTETAPSSRRTVSARSLQRSGFRIQIYSGPATRDSKNKATAAADKLRELFPELKAYPIFVSPRWLCVVGDFLTREEAVKMRDLIRKTQAFGEYSIVRSQVIVAP